MIPMWPGIVEESERKGLLDGLARDPYTPALPWGTLVEADDAYSSAYFRALAGLIGPDKEEAADGAA